MSRRDKGEANYDPQIADVLPLAALDERVAIVGISGAGKTYAAKRWLERLLGAGARVCVVVSAGVISPQVSITRSTLPAAFRRSR